MAAFEQLATGFKVLEGGRVDEEGRAWFSDYARGGIYRLEPDGTLHNLFPEALGFGGLALNDDGRLVISGREGISLLDPDAGTRVPLLLEVDGEPRCFNDVEPDGEGGMFAGTIDPLSFTTGAPPRYGELLHIAADRTVTVLRREIKGANGIAIGPDGGLLYLSDTGTGVRRFALSGRTIGEGVLVAELPDSDGIEVDSSGGLWVARFAAQEVLHLDKDGTRSTLSIPVGSPMTIAFGGPDLKSLHVFAGSDLAQPDSAPRASVFRTKVDMAGQKLRRTSFH